MQSPHNFPSSFAKIEHGRGNKMPSIATRVSKNFQTSNKNHLPQTPTHDLEQNSFSAKITFKYYNVQTLFIHHMHTAFRITELHRMSTR